MRTIAGRGLLAALTVALLVPVQGEAKVPADAVALVGSQSITRATFDHWFRIAAKGAHAPIASTSPPRFAACVRAAPHAVPAAQRRARCRTEYDNLRDQTLQFLISAAWLEGEAALEGVAVTQAEVDAEFTSNRRAEFPRARDFRKFLRESGMTIADLKYRVRVTVVSDRMRQKVTAGAPPVTDAEVAAYYSAHRGRFRIPPRRDLRLVHTRFAWRAHRAVELLRAGAPWSRVARLLSVGGHSRRNGVAPGTTERALDRAIFHAALRRLRGPVHVASGYYVFEVTRVHARRQLMLPDVAPTIGRLLDSEHKQSRLQDFVLDFEQRWKAATICRRGFVTQDCGGTER